METVVQIDSSFFYWPSTMLMLWILIFTSDRLMSYIGAKLYHDMVKHFLLLEDGYHLKDISEYEIGHPSGIITKFLSELIISSTAVWMLLYSCRLLSSWNFYEFFCGAFVLLEACIHFRHMRNVSLFSLAKKNSGLYGCLAIPKWIGLRNNFVEFIIFSLSYIMIFFFDTSNYFVLGGALSCLIASLYYLIYAQQEKKTFLRKNPNPMHEINVLAI